MTAWREACQEAEAQGWVVSEVPLPTYLEEDVLKCLDSCKQNICGTYGKNWACAPGWKDKMDTLGKRFTSCLLMEKRYDVDVRDKEAVKKAADEFQNIVRRTVLSMRAAGYDCLGFADGACGYCGECAYPEPCRFPEQLVPSVSAAGINMSRYFESFGKEFSFGDGYYTHYGVIMFAPGDSSA